MSEERKGEKQSLRSTLLMLILHKKRIKPYCCNIIIIAYNHYHSYYYNYYWPEQTLSICITMSGSKRSIVDWPGIYAIIVLKENLLQIAVSARKLTKNLTVYVRSRFEVNKKKRIQVLIYTSATTEHNKPHKLIKERNRIHKNIFPKQSWRKKLTFREENF